MTIEARAGTQTCSPELQHEIEQFLYREALMLDSRQWDSWYELLAPDFSYLVPLRRHTASSDPRRGLGSATDMTILDEDRASIGWRLRRLGTGKAWAEEPPSFVRRLIGNVMVSMPGVAADTYEVTSSFIVHRSRFDRSDVFTGLRTDVLRSSSSGLGWSIARRVVELDLSVIPQNVTIFF